jgi:hypothetical protein
MFVLYQFCHEFQYFLIKLKYCLSVKFSSYKPSIMLCSYLLQFVCPLLSFSDACWSLFTFVNSLDSCKIMIFLMISLLDIDRQG